MCGSQKFSWTRNDRYPRNLLDGIEVVKTAVLSVCPVGKLHHCLMK